MNWMISLVGMLVVTSLTGSIAQIIWFFTKRLFEKFGYLRWCYIGLWGVTLLYLFPVAFFGMVAAAKTYYPWGGTLFTPTPMILKVCLCIILLWGLGVGVMGIALWRDLRALRKLCRASVECEPWKQELFETICDELHISSKKVELRQSVQVMMPVFAKIIHPTVIIPAIQEFNEEQLRAILLHELTHYKQKDAWLIILARSVKILQFFNPFVWRLNRLTAKWSEFACDSKVYARTGGLKKYYGIIYSMMEAACEMNQGLVAHFGKNGNEVKDRILHMKKFDKAKKQPIGAAVVLSVILLASGSLTVVAANGAGEGYEALYDQTLVEQEEEMPEQVQPVYEEYTDNGPASGITVEEGEVVATRAGSNFSWTVSGDTMKQTSSFHVKAGQEISVRVLIDPENKNVKAGIIDDSGKRRYVEGEGIIEYSFSITSSGSYRMFVENTNSVAVTVMAMYTY